MKMLRNAIKFVLILFPQILLNAQALEWAKPVEGNGFEYPKDMVIDNSGNVYTTGAFQNTVDFDPGSGVHLVTSNGSDDMYVLKLDSDGNFVWVATFGADYFDYSYSIALDPSNNVLIGTQFTNTVDFDPGPGVFNLTSVGGISDAAILKLDPSGNFIWVKQMGANNYDRYTDIAVDNAGNIYATGFFWGTVDMNPNVGTFNLTAVGGNDGFVQKLDASGNFVYAYSCGSSLDDYTSAIDVDPVNQTVWFSSVFMGTIDADPGPGTVNYTSMGSYDAFIAEMNGTNLVWSTPVSGTNVQFVTELKFNAPGEVYAAGYFEDIVDMDPGITTNYLVSEGGYDVYVAKYNGATPTWVRRYGTSDIDFLEDLTVDPSGNTMITGYCGSNMDFDPAQPNINSYNGAYVLTLDPSGNYVQSFVTDYAHGYNVEKTSGGEIYCSGIFGVLNDLDPTSGVFQIPNIDTGYGNIYIQKIVPCTNSASSIFPESCSYYISPSGNQTWYYSGYYQEIIPNSTGCDSIIDVYLTINPPSSSTVTVNACSTYVSPSGNYIWSSTGIYNDTITNSAGCDSTITIFLVIQPPVVSVVEVCNTLISNATGVVSYQWLDCNNGYAPIPGETNQTFSPAVNGNYAVEITQNGCIDTSACSAITSLSITNEGTGTQFEVTVFPNPTQQNIQIQTEAFIKQVDVYNSLGQLVITELRSNFSVVDLSAGVYILHIKTDAGNKSVSFVKSE